MNLRTALYSTHLSAGARMVPFGGWDMPVQYSSILAEVKAVRTATGLFDVSHMGRLYISGPKATDFLGLGVDRLREYPPRRPGPVLHDLQTKVVGSLMTPFSIDCPRSTTCLSPTPANRIEVVAWFQKWIDDRFSGGCDADDRTGETSLLALQGAGQSSGFGPAMPDGGRRPGIHPTPLRLAGRHLPEQAGVF